MKKNSFENSFFDDLFEELSDNFSVGFGALMVAVVVVVIIIAFCSFPIVTSWIIGIVLLIFVGIPVGGNLIRRFAIKKGWMD